MGNVASGPITEMKFTVKLQVKPVIHTAQADNSKLCWAVDGMAVCFPWVQGTREAAGESVSFLPFYIDTKASLGGYLGMGQGPPQAGAVWG